MPVNFRNQSYSSIKKNCLKRGVLFEDPEFPASSKSLYFSKVDPSVEWTRPKELCKVPKLIVNGISCDDLVTGELKNAWFITACTALAHEPSLWNKVVPDVKSQEFDDKNPYAGIFHFQFWRFGELADVVIDDRLPTKDGKLIFLHSNQKNEFWSALLEKAYAKLYGDYESLGSGHASDALVDFTGGVSEKLVISECIKDDAARKVFFNKLETACDQKALINCHIELSNIVSQVQGKITEGNIISQVQDTMKQRGASLMPESAKNLLGTDGPLGLVLGQGYNITMVRTIEVKTSLQGAVGSSALQMVRLFNPMQAKEWTGPWSDNSPEWKRISQQEWVKMGMKFDNEGEFWMSFSDFVTYFTNVDICHFVNTNFFTLKKTWNESIMFSEWSDSGRNGGNVYSSATFLSNPQFMFDIATDEPDAIMASVEQRDVTVGRVPIGDNKNTIGFFIMKVEVNRMYRVHIQGEQMFQSNFFKSRNVFGSCTLPKGRYVIVPCCEQPGASGEFMLRLYTTNKSSAKELTAECPTSGCCAGQYKLVTTLTIEKLEGLQLPENIKGSLDPYVVIRCEGEKITSDFQKGTSSPTFNLTAIFYRKKPAQPIVVEVMNHKMVFSDYLCEARIESPGEEKREKKVCKLYGRKKEADVVKPGELHAYICSSDDLQTL